MAFFLGSMWRCSRLKKQFQEDMITSIRGGKITRIPVIVGPFVSPKGSSPLSVAKLIKTIGRRPDLSMGKAPNSSPRNRKKFIARTKKQLNKTSAVCSISGIYDPQREQIRLSFITRASFPELDYFHNSEHYLPIKPHKAHIEALQILILSSLEPALIRDHRAILQPLQSSLTRLNNILNRPPENPITRNDTKGKKGKKTNPQTIEIPEKQRAGLLHAYAQGALARARFDGAEEDFLPDAIRAAGAAAAGFDAQHDPKRATDARLIVGIALQRLGYKAKDADYLGQALEAFDYAMKQAKKQQNTEMQARIGIRMAETWLEVAAMGEGNIAGMKSAIAAARLAVKNTENFKKSSYHKASQGVLGRVQRMAIEMRGKAA